MKRAASSRSWIISATFRGAVGWPSSAAVFVEPAQGVLDEIIAEGKAFVELALTAADEFHDEQVVKQGIGFLDENFGQSPVVVALLEGALEQLIGYIDGFAHPADV